VMFGPILTGLCGCSAGTAAALTGPDGVGLQASFACLGVCAAGAIAGFAAGASAESHRLELWVMAATSGAASTVWMQYLFYEFPGASEPLGAGVFSCPLVRWVPLAGLASNGFLAAQLPWPAWVRLGALSFTLAGGYGFVERRRRRLRRLSDVREGLASGLISAHELANEPPLGAWLCDSMCFSEAGVVGRASV